MIISSISQMDIFNLISSCLMLDGLGEDSPAVMAIPVAVGPDFIRMPEGDDDIAHAILAFLEIAGRAGELAEVPGRGSGIAADYLCSGVYGLFPGNDPVLP